MPFFLIRSFASQDFWAGEVLNCKVIVMVKVIIFWTAMISGLVLQVQDVCWSQSIAVEELQQGWSAYEALITENTFVKVESLFGEASEVFKFEGQPNSVKYSLWMHGAFQKYVEKNEGIVLVAKNPQYEFEITKHAGEKNTEHPWFVRSVDETPESKTVSRCTILDPVSLAGVEASRLFNSETFELKTVQEAKDSTWGTSVTVDFGCDVTVEAGTRVISGQVVLLKDHYWLVRRCRLDELSETIGEGVVTGENQFEIRAGRPVLRRAAVQYVFPADHTNMLYVDLYTDWEFGTVTDEEGYLLSNYGLPEPSFVKPKTRWGIYAVAIGICLLVLEGTVWLKRRIQ